MLIGRCMHGPKKQGRYLYLLFLVSMYMYVLSEPSLFQNSNTLSNWPSDNRCHGPARRGWSAAAGVAGGRGQPRLGRAGQA